MLEASLQAEGLTFSETLELDDVEGLDIPVVTRYETAEDGLHVAWEPVAGASHYIVSATGISDIVIGSTSFRADMRSLLPVGVLVFSTEPEATITSTEEWEYDPTKEHVVNIRAYDADPTSHEVRFVRSSSLIIVSGADVDASWGGAR